MSYSIIITCRRKPDLLRNLLTKIESNYPIETIVFNIDSVDDEISDICKEFGAIEHKVENTGFAKSFNEGIKLAKFENVIYCQDDITPEPYCFDVLFEAYQNHPYLLLSPNITEDAMNIEVCNGIKEIYYGENYMGRMFACFIITKAKFEEAGGLDSNFYPCYFEDMDFFYRNIKLKGNKVGVVCSSKVMHKPSQTAKTHPDFMVCMDRNHDYYLHKWGGKTNQENFIVPFDGKEAVAW